MDINLCRRVVRPWLGLKMLDLNDMIVAQLKEKDPTFPNVNKGVLVPMVCIFSVVMLVLENVLAASCDPLS
ncbi:unnamed protein product [Ilex paraguariensis]|uniref:Uncharacterized protein n=1 Tax=Ilex paraguariensis TaxID=185542 RepID=A0ABC8R0I6_9AQUA